MSGSEIKTERGERSECNDQSENREDSDSEGDARESDSERAHAVRHEKCEPSFLALYCKSAVSCCQQYQRQQEHKCKGEIEATKEQPAGILRFVGRQRAVALAGIDFEVVRQ